jgi:imidazolonepropionase-like amidohydrolase
MSWPGRIWPIDGWLYQVIARTANLSELMRTSAAYTAARASEIMGAMLRRGFTTVRDAGGADYGLARAVEEGVIVGPRLLFCGHGLSPSGGHADLRGRGEDVVTGLACMSWRTPIQLRPSIVPYAWEFVHWSIAI